RERTLKLCTLTGEHFGAHAWRAIRALTEDFLLAFSAREFTVARVVPYRLSPTRTFVTSRQRLPRQKPAFVRACAAGRSVHPAVRHGWARQARFPVHCD